MNLCFHSNFARDEIIYSLPDINILSKSDTHNTDSQQEEAAREGDLISERTDELGARLNIEDIRIGPQVISFYCAPSEKVLVRLLPRLAAELQFELGSETISIHAPQAGTKYVVVEVPNPRRQLVTLGDIIDSASPPLTFSAGVTTSNETLSIDIRNLPHMLCAGTTGSGKSSFLHSVICSLLMKTTPDELLFHLTDSKMCELTQYDGIPNLLHDCITDAYEAIEHFNVLVNIMECRYKLSQEMGAKEFSDLNSKLSPGEKLPYILIVVDEIADLMALSKHEVEESIVRIAQKARAVGLHLMLATQSPRREVITGLLKANLPSRIAFATSSELDSRIIINQNGAGQLLGNGDCLYSEQGKNPVRMQSSLIKQSEIENIVSSLRANSAPKRELIAA